MDPVCFHIGSRPIYWYGVLVAAAFLAAVAHWNLLGRKTGRPAGFGSELGFWIMLAGIVGSRVAFVVSELPTFIAKPLEIIRFDKGGLIFYGGLAGAVAAVVLLARARKEPILALADFTVSALPLGHALGRIGCFINGCCYGIPTGLALGVRYPQDSEAWLRFGNAALHPVQLYEAALNLAIYGLLLRAYLRRKRNGSVLALYLVTYPVVRFLVEFVRGDDRLRWFGLTVAQEISVGLFVIGVVLSVALARRSRRPKTESPASPS